MNFFKFTTSNRRCFSLLDNYSGRKYSIISLKWLAGPGIQFIKWIWILKIQGLILPEFFFKLNFVQNGFFALTLIFFNISLNNIKILLIQLRSLLSLLEFCSQGECLACFTWVLRWMRIEKVKLSSLETSSGQLYSHADTATSQHLQSRHVAPGSLHTMPR